MLLSQKAAEAEQEITRLRLGAMKVIHVPFGTKNVLFSCVVHTPAPQEKHAFLITLFYFHIHNFIFFVFCWRCVNC
jgi:hypothetical protein